MEGGTSIAMRRRDYLQLYRLQYQLTIFFMPIATIIVWF